MNAATLDDIRQDLVELGEYLSGLTDDDLTEDMQTRIDSLFTQTELAVCPPPALVLWMRRRTREAIQHQLDRGCDPAEIRALITELFEQNPPYDSHDQAELYRTHFQAVLDETLGREGA